MELDHLAIAEKAVAHCERHIAREEQMISDLDRAGQDTELALAVLVMQTQHVAHRDMIRRILQENAAKPRAEN